MLLPTVRCPSMVRARWHVRHVSARAAAASLAGMGLAAGAVVASSPSASAQPPAKASKAGCATPYGLPVKLTLPKVDGATIAATPQGESTGFVAWTCRSVSISGWLVVPTPAASTDKTRTTIGTTSRGATGRAQAKETTPLPVEVCASAESVTQSLGKLVLKLQKQQGRPAKTVVCATPGHPAALDYGWQRPAQTAGDVGTIRITIRRALQLKHGATYPSYDSAQETFHQPVF